VKRRTAESLWWIGLGLTVAATGIAIASTARGETRASAPLRTVEKVDLQRYIGDWYEISRSPTVLSRAPRS
jgi:lipocalin